MADSLKIGCLGAGCWGFCLASILAEKGYRVVSWTTKPDLAETLNKKRTHPFLPEHRTKGDLHVTTKIEEALEGANLVLEAVTSSGIRPVMERVKGVGMPHCPIVITSKGVEQNSGLILPDVALEVLGPASQEWVGMLSGPGYAEEVIRGLPTSVVASAYKLVTMQRICETFTTKTFRVYPNSDLRGVAFGGALKNIIAIACGISKGLDLGWSALASLMTRGLHEVRKLAVAQGCKAETLNGLSGMGDLCMTCSSATSRNFRFGTLLAKGIPPEEASKQIKMVVEGAYTCLSVLQLSKKLQVAMPITETVYKIVYEGLPPKDAVKLLMQRPIKEEMQ
ncbi:MAG: NAD(P)-dependent glycerol-3-phosphate dehydrogenase [Parachlamydia sp.]|nr:NAD(P)-dependent glycerol-3-phosphate dehydrogenase [Parachlamydia sp.]